MHVRRFFADKQGKAQAEKNELVKLKRVERL